MKNNTIRMRVLVFTSVIIFLLLLGFFSVFYIIRSIDKQSESIFSLNIELDSLKEHIGSMESSLSAYLNTKDSDTFVSYSEEKEIIVDKVELIATFTLNPDIRLKLQNITYLTDEFIEISDNAIELKRARNVEEYISKQKESQKISGYILEIISEIDKYEYENSIISYKIFSNSTSQLVKYYIGILVLVLILILLLTFEFTRNILDPIETLSGYAKEISTGNYNVKIEEKDYFKEAHILKEIFKDMKSSIIDHIEVLEDKVEIEKKLSDAEVEKLKMENLLKDAELVALQNQINPHFLFNTLNAGVQLALLEDSDRTSEYLMNLSSLFRYNIQRLSNKVKLNDEINNVKNYANLMNVRFGDMIEFKFEIDEMTEEVEMPPLIVQPVIENSIVHGFRDKVDKGIITIKTKNEIDCTKIIISDNGNGIQEADLIKLNGHIFESVSKVEKHTTGLGMYNVYTRLKNFFGNEDAMKFESTQEHGTTVTLILRR